MVPPKKKRVPPVDPPVPPKKSRRQPVTAEHVVAAQLGGRGRDLEKLRLSAGFYYALSDVTIAEMVRQPPFDQVSGKMLSQWSQQDGWVARRRESEDRARRLVESQMGAQLLRMYRAELAVLVGLFDDATAKLKNAMPNSYEGMLGAIIKLVGTMDTWRQKIEARRPDSAPGNGAAVGVVPAALAPAGATPLSPDEARLLGRELMRARREAMRGQVQQDTAAPPTDTPMKDDEG